MTTLTTETEVAWLDWLDAWTDARESGDPKDKANADQCWAVLMATFLPGELREWGMSIMELRGK
jgi:hypothetical protein